MGLCDLETDMRVTFKAGNLYTEIGHAWPSVSRIICYVPTRQMDRSNVDKLISLCIAVRHPVCICELTVHSAHWVRYHQLFVKAQFCCRYIMWTLIDRTATVRGQTTRKLGIDTLNANILVTYQLYWIDWHRLNIHDYDGCLAVIYLLYFVIIWFPVG